jgi:hypothetical protein
MSTNSSYEDRLLNALIELANDPDVKNWHGCVHSSNNLSNLTVEIDIYNYKHKQSVKKPEYTHRCMCGHHIEENCYIIHLITHKIGVVGNCCIKHFRHMSGNDGYGRQCIECNKPFRKPRGIEQYICDECKNSMVCIHCNKKANVQCCVYCDEKIPVCTKCKQLCIKCYNTNIVDEWENKKITFGKKHNGKTFKFVFNNDQNYCKYILDAEKPSCLSFKQFQIWLTKKN